MQGQNKHHLNLNKEENPKVTSEQLKRLSALNIQTNNCNLLSTENAVSLVLETSS